MSSPRLNHVAKRAQRQLTKARQQAFDQILGRTTRCASCGVDFTLTTEAYRGVAIRDRVAVEAVRFACPRCNAEQAVWVGETEVR
jgi:transcription elongation factor Elf1